MGNVDTSPDEFLTLEGLNYNATKVFPFYFYKEKKAIVTDFRLQNQLLLVLFFC